MKKRKSGIQREKTSGTNSNKNFINMSEKMKYLNDEIFDLLSAKSVVINIGERIGYD